MLDKLIYLGFATLFLLTPLFWTPLNFELFEFNKMMLVYFLTTLITSFWILKCINQKTLILKSTPLGIPLILFLASQILSTIFSMDKHTSIWGYYSRQNGGLLSVIAYLLLYFAFVSNIGKAQVFRLLKVALPSGFIVSIWAISEHFGVSPSCVILRAEFNAACWIQDVVARVFATLGQPNWLAAYLAMLIFPSIYFFLAANTKKSLVSFYLLLVSLYMAFTFTYSRGATLGLIIGILIFIGLQILAFHPKGVNINLAQIKPILIVLVGFLFINLLFGSAFTRFNLSNLFPKSAEPPTTTNYQPLTTLTQLEYGGTESGQIRLIVWQGALDIFRHYPILGSGVETFAYSYYQFRPQAHNLTSEWDFLYNKAHNEYLNYLATTGILGFASYMAIIITFIVWGIKQMSKFKAQMSKGKNLSFDILILALVASYISYLISNFFGFSVVITALFFFLFPALAFVVSDSTRPLRSPSILDFIYRRSIYTKTIQIIFLLFTFYFLLSIIHLWYADTHFARGMNAQEAGNVGKSYNFLTEAVNLRPSEDFYRSELGFAAAASALALRDTDATLSSQLKNQAVNETEKALAASPKNVSFWRTAARTYFELSSLDETYLQKTLDALDQAIKLAPTDPKLLYNKAVILGQAEKPEEAIKVLQEAIRFKPNYREGYLALSLFYFDEGQKLEAVESMRKVLQIVPNDVEALQYLNDWGRQGIATGSGKP